MTHSVSQVVKRIAGAGAISVSYSAINFYLNVFIAREFGAVVFAEYSLYITLVSLFGLVCAAGMDTLLMRSSSHDELRITMGKANSIVIGMLVLTMPLLFLYGVDGERSNFFIYGASVFFVASSLLRQGASIYIDKQSAFQLIEKLLRVLFLFLSIVWLSGWLDVKSSHILLASLISFFFSYIVGGFFFRKNSIEASSYSLQIDAAIIKPGLMLLVSNLLLTLITAADLLMINAMGSSIDVAAYSAAQKFSIVTSLLMYAVNVAIAPLLLKRSGANGDHNKKQVRISLVLSFWFSFLYLGLCLLFGRQMLSIFGDAYDAAYGVLVILTFSSLMSVYYGQTFTLMKIHGREWVFLRVISCACLIKALLAFVLYDRLGVLAIAMATLIAVLFWNAVSHYYLRVALDIDSMARS